MRKERHRQNDVDRTAASRPARGARAARARKTRRRRARCREVIRRSVRSGLPNRCSHRDRPRRDPSGRWRASDLRPRQSGRTWPPARAPCGRAGPPPRPIGPRRRATLRPRPPPAPVTSTVRPESEPGRRCVTRQGLMQSSRGSSEVPGQRGQSCAGRREPSTSICRGVRYARRSRASGRAVIDTGWRWGPQRLREARLPSAASCMRARCPVDEHCGARMRRWPRRARRQARRRARLRSSAIRRAESSGSTPHVSRRRARFTFPECVQGPIARPGSRPVPYRSRAAPRSADAVQCRPRWSRTSLRRRTNRAVPPPTVAAEFVPRGDRFESARGRNPSDGGEHREHVRAAPDGSSAVAGDRDGDRVASPSIAGFQDLAAPPVELVSAHVRVGNRVDDSEQRTAQRMNRDGRETFPGAGEEGGVVERRTWRRRFVQAVPVGGPCAITAGAARRGSTRADRPV